MKRLLVSLCWLIAGAVLQPVTAQTRTSADYALSAETEDAGGGRATSADYAADCGIGAIGGIGMVANPPLVAKSGYIGQLYDPAGLAIGASPSNINETTSRQLGAAEVMDDGTLLPLLPSSVSWGVVAGPILSISIDGLAITGNVYKDTPAIVLGNACGFGAALGLLVANVTSDDFGLYAGDGIDDDWQVLHFGESNPDASPGRDPDGDGRDNLFESLALTIPTDASSCFRLRARPNPGQPDCVDLVFGPIQPGRMYTTLQSPDLSEGSWIPLTGTSQSEEGQERIVTDPGTSGMRKFYRIQIGR